MALTNTEAVHNLEELRGPTPDAAARERRLRQAADVLLDRIDSKDVTEAYRAATRETQA